MKRVKELLQNSMLIVAAVILSTSSILAQGNERQIVIGSRDVIQKTIEVSPFRSIQIDDYDVVLVQDTLYEVRISGEDNIIEEIQVISANGVLSTQVTRGVTLRKKEPIQIFVHFIDINEINAENARYETLGSITTDSLQVTSTSTNFNLEVYVESLRVDLGGTSLDRGVLFATGNAVQCNVFLTGRGSFDSPELTGDNFIIAFQERSLYRIKRDNFKESNVKSSTNRMQRIGYTLVNIMSFIWW